MSRAAFGDFPGILYETASRLCTQRAKKGSDDLRFSSLLPRTTPNLDMTLLSWLQSIPTEAFTYQFEEKTLPLNYRELEKPLLEATWTELIQQTPIRLHSAASRESGDGVMTASARVAVNDRMVQSMVEQMDGFRRRSSGFNSQSARHKSLSQSFHLGMSGQEDPLANDMFSSPRRHQSPVISRSARPDLSTSVTQVRLSFTHQNTAYGRAANNLDIIPQAATSPASNKENSAT